MSVRRKIAAALCGYLVLVACVAVGSRASIPERHRWWAGLGPVLPHESFPSDCSMCHVGTDWRELTADFEFDHFAETGVALEGAHASALCLRCHNDRGPAGAFAAQGCAGCHEDVHRGQLGKSCDDCHNEANWRVDDAVARHRQTRFPLVGVHAAVSCRRCHPGAEVGAFAPTPIDCVDCHRDDLAAATTPDHFALGYVQSCDRCHSPFDWNLATLDPTFPD